MPKSYFSFGQGHRHVLNDVLLDKDIILEVEADSPRDEMFKHFGPKWSMEYDDQNPPTMRYYSRGKIRLDDILNSNES